MRKQFKNSAFFKKRELCQQTRAKSSENTIQVHRAIKAQNTFRPFGSGRNSTWSGFFSVSILCRFFAFDFYKMKRDWIKIRLNLLRLFVHVLFVETDLLRLVCDTLLKQEKRNLVKIVKFLREKIDHPRVASRPDPWIFPNLYANTNSP